LTQKGRAVGGPLGQSKTRVQFMLPKQVVERLDGLKTKMGASSRTEVLKIALELLHWAMLHRARGEDIAAVREGKVAEKIAIPGIGPSMNLR